MNDLPNVAKNGKICMYVDDTNLSTNVNKVSDISDQLIPEFTNILRHVLFDIRAGNSNLAKSLGEKSNHAMYQDEKPHRCLLSLQN